MPIPLSNMKKRVFEKREEHPVLWIGRIHWKRGNIMTDKKKPLLTIGIIFKNEIRCLERCLKSFQTLRDTLPCELIMADTGADDGSREVAERYADTVFDFPWINDFAAARNAVMARARGEWYFTVDCDEYLDEDISQLVDYLRGAHKEPHDCATVQIRNYANYDRDDIYSDFTGVRLLRMSTGVRYEGAIHEAWAFSGEVHCYGLRNTILHHDGYVDFGGDGKAEKRRRNMELLKKELEREPQNMGRLLQAIESSEDDEDAIRYVRTGIQGIQERWESWNKVGANIIRHGISMATARNLPELEEWLALAEELFGDHIIIRTDMAYVMFAHFFNRKERPACITWGERYLQGLRDYHDLRFDHRVLLTGDMKSVGPAYEHSSRIMLADVYRQEKRYQESWEMLRSADVSQLRTIETGNYFIVLLNLHSRSELDMSAEMVQFWQKVVVSEQDRKRADEKIEKIVSLALPAFSQKYQDEEREKGRVRHAWTLFSGLGNDCPLGVAARMLETDDPEELEQLLSNVTQWALFPVQALRHGLAHSINFPLYPMLTQQLDILATRLAAEDLDWLMEFAFLLPIPKNMTDLNWVRAIILSAVVNCSWEEEEQSWRLMEKFVALEEELLPRWYAAEVLTEENARCLPLMHCFGWYCIQTFGCLRGGDRVGAVRWLHKALEVCPDQSRIISVLLECVSKLELPDPSLEMMELAGKIRGLLAGYHPDDPAVQELKNSKLYKEFSFLLEINEHKTLRSGRFLS